MLLAVGVATYGMWPGCFLEVLMYDHGWAARTQWMDVLSTAYRAHSLVVALRLGSLCIYFHYLQLRWMLIY
jgi:hypothetical protein